MSKKSKKSKRSKKSEKIQKIQKNPKHPKKNPNHPKSPKRSKMIENGNVVFSWCKTFFIIFIMKCNKGPDVGDAAARVLITGNNHFWPSRSDEHPHLNIPHIRCGNDAISWLQLSPSDVARYRKRLAGRFRRRISRTLPAVASALYGPTSARRLWRHRRQRRANGWTATAAAAALLRQPMASGVSSGSQWPLWPFVATSVSLVIRSSINDLFNHQIYL